MLAKYMCICICICIYMHMSPRLENQMEKKENTVETLIIFTFFYEGFRVQGSLELLKKKYPCRFPSTEPRLQGLCKVETSSWEGWQRRVGSGFYMSHNLNSPYPP